MPRIAARKERTKQDWAVIRKINKAGEKRKASGLSFFKRHSKIILSQGRDEHKEPVAGTSRSATKRKYSTSSEEGRPDLEDLAFISKFRHQLSPSEDSDSSTLDNFSNNLNRDLSDEEDTITGVDNLFSDYSDSDDRLRVFEEYFHSTKDPAVGPYMDVDIMETDGREKRDVPALGKEGGQGSGSTGEQSIKMYKSMGAIHDGNKILIHHAHMFYVWGCAWKNFDVKFPNQTVSPATRRVTSAVQLARNELLYYMSPAEFKNLPPNCTVNKIGLRVTPIATEASFATGSTVSGFASLKHAEFGIVNKGMNLDVMLEPVNIEIGQDMIISDIKTESAISEILWGKADMSDFPACLGVGRNFPNYDSIILPKKDFSKTNNIWSDSVEFGTVDLASQYTKFNMNEAISTGKHFDWVYTPKIGTIKMNKKAHGVMKKGDQFIIGSEYLPMGIQEVVDQDNFSRKDWKYGPLSVKDNTDYLSSVVEHGYWSGQLNRHNSAPRVPSFSFGLLPIPTNVPQTGTNTYVNAKTTFMLETFIEIVPSTFTYTTIEPTMSASSEIMHYLPMKSGITSFIYDCGTPILSNETVKRNKIDVINPLEANKPEHLVSYDTLNENYHKLYEENQNIKLAGDSQKAQLESRVLALTKELDEERKKRRPK